MVILRVCDWSTSKTIVCYHRNVFMISSQYISVSESTLLLKVLHEQGRIQANAIDV